MAGIIRLLLTLEDEEDVMQLVKNIYFLMKN
jgi:transcriptional/translational regulatory protein YebC/TACO1